MNLLKQRKLLLVLIIELLFFMCTAMYSPVIPIIVESLGYNLSMIGIVQTVVNIAPLICAMPVGILMKRKGFKIPLSIMCVISACISVILYLSQNLINIILILSIMKITEIFICVGLQEQVAVLSKKNKLEGNYGWFMVFASIGSLLGPILGGIITDNISINTIWFIMACVLVIISLLTLTIKTENGTIEEKEKASKTNNKYLKSICNSMLVISALAGSAVLFAHGSRYNFLPLYLKKLDFSVTAIGTIMAIRSFAAIGGGIVLPQYVKLLKGNVQALISSTAILAISLATIPLCTTLATQYVNSIVIGVAMGIATPISNAMIVSSVAAENRTIAIGFSQTVNRIGQLLSPLLFGILAEFSGITSSFVGGGAVLIIIDFSLIYIFLKGTRSVIIRNEDNGTM